MELRVRWFGGQEPNPNGVAHWKYYDSLGNLAMESWVDGSNSVAVYMSCDNVLSFVPKIPQGCGPGRPHAYYKATTGRDGTQSYEYYDVLGRKTLDATPSADGTYILTTNQYDEAGRLTHQSTPFFASASDPLQFTVTAFDVLNRPVSITYPDGGVATSVYEGLKTTTTDPMGRQEVLISDPFGDLLQTVHVASGATTTYTTGTRRKLLTSTSPSGAKVVRGYDVRGRLVSVSDPDRGDTSYEYNCLDQMVKEVDHTRGVETDTTYDLLGRPLTKVSGAYTYTFTYDSPSALGLPASDTSSEGINKYYRYDSFGRLVNETWVYQGLPRMSNLYTYDTLSRLLRPATQSGLDTARRGGPR